MNQNMFGRNVTAEEDHGPLTESKEVLFYAAYFR